ncbi:50S ribosomal protein L28 [Fusobacterium mortiferum]|jgi:large subunit ribosomal protein L28|uniref:Large ribosomal subunit protein bL28 n=2 Tax=Fusobacterium TaxID=848 RepID=A0ABS2G3U1_FUSMR|nr:MULTISPECIES: 50S ribosomal protein L28 [Fusobacterium]MBU3842865.1 50S ribosomal protein L28 [Candidatus Fusobacterium pullicola]MBM6690842.1 50S ribosomal protein L28 [Fusobacterium mortiferum]MBM6822383.1 50S ribosomal protein L28 [Fusobacterium mortiferum]MBM6875410.1 50S ribosomal protein L28 [Fusobacterium mortiferum]MDO5788999.1 50S ribosomal protein L28 [Fusobacterium sp.]
MQRCEITGVGLISGNQISHSHRLTRRVWKPNLQVTSINVNGTPVKVKVCSRTLKTLKGLNDVEVMKFLKANAATLSTRLQKAMAK